MLARLIWIALPALALSLPPFSSAGTACVPFTEARKHIGDHRCVTGKVLRVQKGKGGVHFFDFCEDYRVCPFTVVVFPSDLKKIGDLRQLQGRQIEIEGPVKEYDGRAEIILKRLSQLRGDAARIPPLPKDYDVERRGHYSAGKFSRAKPSKTAKPKSQPQPMESMTEED
jgi:hypothetical protein